MIQAGEPPPVVEVAPVQATPDFVVVRQETRNDIVSSADTWLSLAKGAKSEAALLRQAIFVTSKMTVVRSTVAAGPEALRWTYEPFLHRQLCFTSITGQFACTVAETSPLPDKASGEAPLAPAAEPAGPIPETPSDAARGALFKLLGARAPSLFAEDRKLKIDPMLKAAGVSVRLAQPAGQAR